MASMARFISESLSTFIQKSCLVVNRTAKQLFFPQCSVLYLCPTQFAPIIGACRSTALIIGASDNTEKEWRKCLVFVDYLLQKMQN